MGRSTFSGSLLSRFRALFKSADFDASTFTPERIAARIQLPFAGLEVPPLTISWKKNLYFQHLYELPRGALSGPVQEDKAAAHALLAKLVNKDIDTETIVDLRDVYGLTEPLAELTGMQDLETLAASKECRHIRIISYRDFEKTITQAIPLFLSDEPIYLRQASWLGESLFWSGEQHSYEFACAVVYARRRGLELPKRTHICRYSLNINTLQTVRQTYHMLIMPEQAWSDREFMAILLHSGCPYARLALNKAPAPLEVLLLPKNQATADTLGKGLLMAGAQDACEILLQLALH